jgi:hypothetical protein
MTSLEQRLQKIAEKLARQGEELVDYMEKSDDRVDALHTLRKELADLKKAAQSTPQFPSRAASNVLGEIGKSGMPSDFEKGIRDRLAGFISADTLYKIFGLIRRRYD